MGLTVSLMNLDRLYERGTALYVVLLIHHASIPETQPPFPVSIASDSSGQ